MPAGFLLLSFRIFRWVLTLDWGYPILWYPIVAPEPLEECEHSFRGCVGIIFIEVLFFVGVFLRGVRSSAPGGCSPQAFRGVQALLQRLLVVVIEAL
jgi:hypothetical protein